MTRLAVLEDEQRAPIFGIGDCHTLSVTSAASVQTPAVGANTQVVSIGVSASAYVAIGDNPMATVNDFFVPTGFDHPFLRIQPGHRVAALGTSGTTTFVYIAEMT